SKLCLTTTKLDKENLIAGIEEVRAKRKKSNIAFSEAQNQLDNIQAKQLFKFMF
ncbi:11575_t:CDS:1, partial [Gigaspora margarita]